MTTAQRTKPQGRERPLIAPHAFSGISKAELFLAFCDVYSEYSGVAPEGIVDVQIILEAHRRAQRMRRAGLSSHPARSTRDNP